jgi:hypothetical protein
MTLNYASRPGEETFAFLPYTVTSGGPVVAIPAEVAGRWGQGSPLGKLGSHTDYDRACEPEVLIPTAYRGVGWVEVVGARALVFDLDCYTHFLRLAPGFGVLYRTEAEQITEAEVLVALERVRPDSWRQLPVPFVLADGHFFAFDSAFAGATSLQGFDPGAFAMECVLESGTYDVSFSEVDGSDVIRLVRQD